MAIEIANQTKSLINKALIKKSIDVVLRSKKVSGDVSVVILGDAAMTKLNKKFRHKNKPTDILSFAERDSKFTEAGFIGELFIDLAQIKRQAKLLKNSLKWELAFITIHGALHLLGHEDETEKGRLEMEKLGYQLIKKVIK